MKVSLETFTSSSAKWQNEYADTLSKLEKVNKARCDLEARLTDEIEKSRSLADIVRQKKEKELRLREEIEDLERQKMAVERDHDSMEL